ncbi:MAG: SGNH/GDSL hydrolase family protein [Bacteroidota bacterium]|nr:SGNH/GDSL hydrolase family protein [Bacteroidota bacterium]
MKKIIFILISLVLLVSCERKIDEFKPDANGVDFSNFVAVGNSLTSGYANGALYKSGQENSIPNIMAQQFKLVGGGEFRQPLLETEDGVGVSITSNGFYYTTKLSLQLIPDMDCDGKPYGTYSLKPSLYNPNVDQNTLKTNLLAKPAMDGPYNNMAVPGATAQTLFMSGYGLWNPFFKRFATNLSTSIMADAVVQKPTFFYLWIGNNDVLASALEGTDRLITPVDTFAKYFTRAVKSLAESGKSPKGVVATIPDVASAAYFSTISSKLPYNSVNLTAAEASGLNTLYSMYGHPEIVWKEGKNPFVIANSETEWVQMGPEDLFLLNFPTDSVKCKGMGVADQSGAIPKPYPIPGEYVLDKNEQTNIQNAIKQYNEIILANAVQYNLAVADMNAYMKTLQPGIIFDGIKMSLQFVQGGVFSTDGLHLTPRGNAMVANRFIQAINSKYGCNIPQVDVTQYKGIVFP